MLYRPARWGASQPGAPGQVRDHWEVVRGIWQRGLHVLPGRGFARRSPATPSPRSVRRYSAHLSDSSPGI